MWVLRLVGFDHQPYISSLPSHECRRECPLKGMNAAPGVFTFDPGVEVKTEAKQSCIVIESEVRTRKSALLVSKRLDGNSW